MAKYTFHRGAVALDFVGTLCYRPSRAEERIPDGRALGEWLHEAGLGETRPTAAEHDAALELREAIARIAAALVEERNPNSRDVTILNRALEWMKLGSQHIAPRSLAIAWQTRDPVRFALGRIAADAARVFGEQREQLTRCELPACAAFLLSQSRGERRRWCSDQTCGNRARVAAYRARRTT